MTAEPIPTTARVPFWHTPLSQDADRQEREGLAALRSRERQLEALIEETYHRPRATQDPDPKKVEQIRIEGELVHDAHELLKDRIADIRKRYPKPQRLLLAVPTAIDRDSVNARMIRLGLRQVTIEHMRATTVEALWSIDWGSGIGTHENDMAAEGHANFLDMVWQQQEAQEEADRMWREQETQRVLDIAAGAPHRDPAPMPAKIVAVRDSARLSSLVDRVTQESQALRDLAADGADFGRRNALLQVRLQLREVENFPEGVQVVIDPRNRAATAESVESVREEMSDVDWADLNQKIFNLYNLSGEEEKNSDSPLGNPSTQNSSVEPSGALVSNDGTMTASNTGPAPVAASETIIEQSSHTITASATPESTAATPIPTAPL